MSDINRIIFLFVNLCTDVIQFNFCLHFMKSCTVWLKIEQTCETNLVLSNGVCIFDRTFAQNMAFL